jgi:hypothetical protein
VNLEKSIKNRWRTTQALVALVPAERVIMGRVPGTQVYPFPYVSYKLGTSRMTKRSRTTMYYQQTLTFRVWVDDAKADIGDNIANAITDYFCNQCWPIDAMEQVIDVRDIGRAVKEQTTIANVKAWQIVKMMQIATKRKRVDVGTCCPTSSGSESSTSFPSSSVPSNQSSSRQSQSQQPSLPSAA